MGKLYFHCGDYHNIPEGTHILGSLKFTGAQMSAIGSELRAPADGSSRSVFSNNCNAFFGLLVAVREGKVDPNTVSFVFHSKGGQKEIGVGVDGDLKDMAPGFFDQNEIDLLKLF